MAIVTDRLAGCAAGAHRQIPAIVLSILVLAAGIDLRAQGEPEPVGRIEGDDIAVKSRVSSRGEAGEPGPFDFAQGRPVGALSNGSEVTVRSGQARIVLAEGGEIDVCAPAQFTVLKNGTAVTLALHFGRLHLRIAATLPLTVYSALLIATPVSIGGEPCDQVIGLQATGALCVLALQGAVRLEQQLTGASIVLPQRGEIELPDGQFESLHNSNGSCRCDVVLAEDLPQPPKHPEASVNTANSVNQTQATDKKEELRAQVGEDPKWTVVMPPLVFDASSLPPEPEPNPEAALLYREARPPREPPRAGEAETPRATSQKNTAAEAHPGPEQKPAAEQKRGFLGRVKHFFRRLFGGKSKG